MSEEKTNWFRRRSYGYGWRPITWQGWLVTLLTIVSILCSGAFVKQFPTNLVAIYSIIQIFISVIVLIFVCVASGPTPTWQWGHPTEQKVVLVNSAILSKSKSSKKRK